MKFAIALIFFTMAAVTPRGFANELVLFALNDAAAIESLRLHGKSASSLSPQAASVSPQWFAASADGDVDGAVSSKLMEFCREAGIAVMPAVINRGFSPAVAAQMLKSRHARARFRRELVALARRHGFSGYVMDFENLALSPRIRRDYATLLAELHSDFRRVRLSLRVALPAPSPQNLRIFDFKAAARYADRVVLMAYDQHGRLNLPGPIAGYPWVDASLRATLKMVPAKKLLLGVAFYHRNWGESGATAGSYNDALALLKHHGAGWQWHSAHRAHWFGFVEEGRVHTVWVEDARSVAEKLALARRYKLAGVAGWRLGQEDPRVWVMLRDFQGN